MDNAYQGFASGDLNQDGLACRLFADKDIDMIIAQSFSKNFGLYSELRLVWWCCCGCHYLNLFLFTCTI